MKHGEVFSRLSRFWRYRWVVGLAGLMVGTGAWAGPSLDRIRQSAKVIVAHRESSVPFSYLDGNGKPIGYAMDLCAKFVEATRKHLGMKSLEVVYLQVNATNRISAMEEGKADFECESTSNNAERREKVAFVVPHFITGTRFLVRADSSIEKFSDFAGKKLASTVNSTPLKEITKKNKENSLQIQIVDVPDHKTGVEMVATGKVDGFAMDEILIQGQIAARTDRAVFKIVGKYLTIEALGIMISKKDPELKKIADDEMKRLIHSREAYALHEKWFMQAIPPNGQVINAPMNHLHRDFWKYPNDWIPQ